MSVIQVKDLTFSYDGGYDFVFKNASFQIDTNWRLGFIGRNGRGKTTFLKLLMGEMNYQGTITASVNFEYFPFRFADDTQLTIDAIREKSPMIEDWEIYRELNMLDVDDDVLYRSLNSLSDGEKTKIMLATLFLRENSFLLIDEPTNHLDIKGREAVAEYLKKKKGFILVSHDRTFLDSCINYVLSINKADIEVQRGNFTSWHENKQRQDNFEIEQNSKLQKEITQLEAAVKRTAAWSDKAESKKIGFDPRVTEKSMGRRPLQAAKAKKQMARSKAIQQRQNSAIEEKSALLHNIEYQSELKLTPLKYHSNVLLIAKNIAIMYDDRCVCNDVSFSICEGDRIALSGKNGSGKSSILKLLVGENITYTGELIKNHQLKISYIPQNTSHLKGTLVDYALAYAIDYTLFLTILKKLDFKPEQFEKRIEYYSDGQKKKVMIARSLCEKAHLYIWDEPLNFIDVISRMQIEALILSYKPTLLFVEHDSSFCQQIVTKNISLTL